MGKRKAEEVEEEPVKAKKEKKEKKAKVVEEPAPVVKKKKKDKEAKKSPKASPKTSPKASPKKSPKTSPKTSPKAGPKVKKKISKTSPKTSPKKSPKKSPKSSPKAGPKKSPKKSPKAAPKKVVEEDSDSDDEPPKKSPKKSPKAAPKDADDDDEGPYKIVAKNLSFKVDEKKLETDFKACGKVEDVKLLKNDDGWSRGIAFITFETKAGMEKAMEWNGTSYEGRDIVVDKATNNKGKGKDGKGKGKGKGKGEKPDGCKSLLCKGFSQAVEEDDLWEFFSECSSLSRVKLLTDKETGESKCLAFLDFDDEDDIDKGMKLNGKELKGKAVYLDYSRPKEKGEGKDGKGKGKGKDGKGKGKGKDGKGKGKGKDKGDSAARAKAGGAIQEFEGKKVAFDDDSD